MSVAAIISVFLLVASSTANATAYASPGDLIDIDWTNRTEIHFSDEDFEYHLSWIPHPDETFNWPQARKYCRSLGMESISMEDAAKWKFVKDVFTSDPPLRFIWTSGRKCNYRGCPRDNPFWFWSSKFVQGETKKIVTENAKCGHCGWSAKGSLRKPQPDNREGLFENRDEACLAVLDGLYGDGLTWHDIACHHIKPVICERRRSGN